MGPVWGLGGGYGTNMGTGRGYGTSMALGLGTGSSKSIGMEAGSRWPPSPTCAWGCCGAAAAPGRGRCCSLCPPGRAGGRGAASPSTPGTPSPGPLGWTGSSAAGGGDMKGGPSNLGRWFGGARTPKSRDLGVEMGSEAWQHGVRHWDAWLPWKPEEDVGLRWDMGQKRGQWGQKGSAWGSIKIGRWFGGARTPKSRDLGVEMGGEA